MNFKDIFILSACSYKTKNNKTYCDYRYIEENEMCEENDNYFDNLQNNLSNKIKILRISNVRLEFLVLRFPGLEIDEFKELINNTCDDIPEINTNIIHMRDSQFFTPELNDYIKVSSVNNKSLNKAYNDILEAYRKYISSKTLKRFNNHDQIIYKYSESPFRNLTDMNVSNAGKFLSTKYNIPQVGAIKINVDKFKCCYDKDLNANILNIDFADLDKNIKSNNKIFEESNNSLNKNIKILTYDLETYTPNMNNTISNLAGNINNPIISIGFTISNITDPKPLQRCVLICKDFDLENHVFNEDDYKAKLIKSELYNTKDNKFDYKVMYINDYKDMNDPSIYITTNNEKRMLELFMKIVQTVKPYVICSFNGWKFDDIYLNTRYKLYNLQNEFIKANNCNSKYLGDSDFDKPKFKTLNIKLEDGMSFDNKESYMSYTNTFTTYFDIMFVCLKRDAKIFNTSQSHSLINMLKHYDIHNPYANNSTINNDKVLSKSGLTYEVMFDYWRRDINIYDIAHYCLQDAWITSVLGIQLNLIGDKLEMSNMSGTSFQDSIFRADHIRVGTTLKKYAHLDNIALYDKADTESREYELKSMYGDKKYDFRPYIGGAVRNNVNGNYNYVVAVDFSSMYPSQKEGSNIDTSSRVDEIIINNPEEFGLELIGKHTLEDMYGRRDFYQFKDKNNKIFNVEQNFAEFKINISRLKEIYEHFQDIRLIEHNNQEINIQQRKLMLKGIKEELYPIFQEYTLDQLIEIIKINYYEKNNIPIDKKIPLTVKIPLYFCQSPKDSKTLLPTEHYSLKESFLSDFRATRKKVKSIKPVDKTHELQLSSKEKAIKVVMNAEYGQTASNAFGWYDPEIAAATTYASRSCIRECRSCLESEHFYVDEEYLENQNLNKLIQEIKNCSGRDDVVKIEKIIYEPLKEINSVDYILEGSILDREIQNKIANEINLYKRDNNHKLKNINEIDIKLPPRRLTISRLYYKLRKLVLDNPNYKVELYRITLPKSLLTYQDTDSNYYTNKTIVDLFNRTNSETINKIMNILFIHNKLISNLIKDIIARPPIATDFEGAFITVRYLNKKKKYYGKKWTPGVKSWIEIPRNKDYILNDYEKNNIIVPIRKDANNHGDPQTLESLNGVLPDNYYIRYDYLNLPNDYEKYLSSKCCDQGLNLAYYTTIPFKDGTYIDVENATNEDLSNILDYVSKYGIKCTGVDIARRDQYKFINHHHLLIFKQDLIVKDINKDIETKHQNNSIKLKDVIDKLLLDFAGYYTQDQFRQWIDKKDNVINCCRNYPLEYYAKVVKYKTNKNNGSSYMINKVVNDIKQVELNSQDCYKSILKCLEDYFDNSRHLETNSNIPSNVRAILEELKELDFTNKSLDERYIIISDYISKIQNELNLLGMMVYSIDKYKDEIKNYSLSKELKSIIPKEGDRFEYVVLDDKYIGYNSNYTKCKNIVQEKSFMLDHLKVKFGRKDSNGEWCDYENEIYSRLDYRYYYEMLSSNLLRYVAIELDPYIISEMNKFNTASDEEIKIIEKKLEDKIKKITGNVNYTHIDKYYPLIYRNVKKDYRNVQYDNILNNIRSIISKIESTYNIKIKNNIKDIEGKDIINFPKNTIDNLYKTVIELNERYSEINSNNKNKFNEYVHDIIYNIETIRESGLKKSKWDKFGKYINIYMIIDKKKTQVNFKFTTNLPKSYGKYVMYEIDKYELYKYGTLNSIVTGLLTIIKNEFENEINKIMNKRSKKVELIKNDILTLKNDELDLINYIHEFLTIISNNYTMN